MNGKKGDEISLGMAESIAKEYGLGVPKKSEITVQKRLPKSGLMTRMFASSYVDGEGNLRFKDYGSWGTYVGDVDDAGKREGKGKITYDNGGFYDGEFKDNKFEGKGVYEWEDGERFEGDWKNGERSGKGTFLAKDGKTSWWAARKSKSTNQNCKMNEAKKRTWPVLRRAYVETA